MAQSPIVGPRALIPNPALKPFEFLIGEWRTIGSHPQMPGKALPGRTSFAWYEGGAFLIMRNQVDEEGFPDGVAILGSDESAGSFTMIYFDERGVSRQMGVTPGNRTLTWRHDDSKFAQSLTITAQEDGTLVSKGKMSKDGGAWTDDLSQVFTRES